VDRGPDSRKALELLERLQDEARRSGGAVHALLGNHEIMRMLGDLHYVTPGEYEAFVTPKSERIRSDFVDQADKSLREQLLKDTPLGFVEMRVAFGRNGPYGEWLRKLDVVVKINGVLFVHGGISPGNARMSCDAVNTAVRREITADIDKTRSAPLESLSAGETGPLWYRGLAQEPDAFAPNVDEILAKQNARALVIAHRRAGRPDQTRFDGKVIQIDTGMQPAYVERRIRPRDSGRRVQRDLHRSPRCFSRCPSRPRRLWPFPLTRVFKPPSPRPSASPASFRTWARLRQQTAEKTLQQIDVIGQHVEQLLVIDAQRLSRASRSHAGRRARRPGLPPHRSSNSGPQRSGCSHLCQPDFPSTR
jgi:hypothetical protein